MKEIEVKILEIDVEEVRKKLLALGAEKVLDTNLEYTIFDFPDCRLFKKRNLLRVRKVNDKVELCLKHKNKQEEVRSAEEIEINTSDYEKTIQILLELNFQIVTEGKKHRKSYILGKIKFEIDTYPDIPAYLEIESDNEKDLREAVKKLGFTMEQTTSMNGFELIQKYRGTPCPAK